VTRSYTIWKKRLPRPFVANLLTVYFTGVVQSTIRTRLSVMTTARVRYVANSLLKNI